MLGAVYCSAWGLDFSADPLSLWCEDERKAIVLSIMYNHESLHADCKELSGGFYESVLAEQAKHEFVARLGWYQVCEGDTEHEREAIDRLQMRTGSFHVEATCSTHGGHDRYEVGFTLEKASFVGEEMEVMVELYEAEGLLLAVKPYAFRQGPGL